MNKVIICLLFLVTSCSTYLETPESPLDKIFKTASSGNERAAIVAHQASQGKFQCDELRELADNKNFSLYPWVKAQLILGCKLSSSEISKIYQESEKLPKWSHPFIYQAILSKSKNLNEIVNAAIKLTPYLKTQNQRIKTLKSVIQISKSDKELVQQATKELEKISPRHIKVHTLENMHEIARDYEKNRDFKKARRLYRKIINNKKATIEQVIAAWDRVRMSYKLERDRKTYRQKTYSLVQYLKRNLANSHAKDKYFEFSIILARIYWTQDKLYTAKKILRNLLTFSDISEDYQVQTYYNLGGIYEDLGNRKRTLHFYKKAFSTITKEHDLKDQILWNISWYYYRKKNYPQAKEWLSKYESDDPDHKFQFWLAKTHERLGEIKQANQLYNELSIIDDHGFYGQISHKTKGYLPPLPRHNSSFNYKTNALSWALYIENYELAKSIVDNTPKDELKFSELYHAQYYDKLIFKFFALEDEEKEVILADTPEYSFPLAYKEDFIKYDQSTKVSPALLMSIARQESAFNRFARSPADAFGLLQVIPSQAKRLSKRYKINYQKFDDLYKPEINIALSSKLLEELMRRQKNNFVYFIASYNAGENAVRRWRRRIKVNEMMEFIEAIPYKETRKYVKLVARNFFVYQRLLSEKPIKISEGFFTQGSY